MKHANDGRWGHKLIKFRESCKVVNVAQSSSKPPGPNFVLETPDGPIREGGLFTKPNDSFLVLLNHSPCEWFCLTF